MNENVWDPATVQQAPHPGFMPPCPQSLPKISLLLHRFLTTFYPKTLGKKKKPSIDLELELGIQASYTGPRVPRL